MNYAKLINGHLVLAPRSVIVGDRQIGNPPAEMLAELGYKPVVYTEPPSIEPGYEAVESWYDDGSTLRQTWTVLEKTELNAEEVLELLLEEEEDVE